LRKLGRGFPTPDEAYDEKRPEEPARSASLVAARRFASGVCGRSAGIRDLEGAGPEGVRQSADAGTGIEGGERPAIAAGDIIHIPAKIPHRVIAAAGQHVTYVNMRFAAE